MSKYVFIGSEAEGYYSGAYECVGVVVPKEVYDEYEKVLSDIFEGKHFYELDGKHSEVRGTELTTFFETLAEVVSYVNNSDVDLDEDVFGDYLYEYVDGEDITEEDQQAIEMSVKETHIKIGEFKKGFENVSFYLTKENAEKVRAFVESLTK